MSRAADCRVAVAVQAWAQSRNEPASAATPRRTEERMTAKKIVTVFAAALVAAVAAAAALPQHARGERPPSGAADDVDEGTTAMKTVNAIGTSASTGGGPHSANPEQERRRR